MRKKGEMTMIIFEIKMKEKFSIENSLFGNNLTFHPFFGVGLFGCGNNCKGERSGTFLRNRFKGIGAWRKG